MPAESVTATAAPTPPAVPRSCSAPDGACRATDPAVHLIPAVPAKEPPPGIFLVTFSASVSMTSIAAPRMAREREPIMPPVRSRRKRPRPVSVPGRWSCSRRVSSMPATRPFHSPLQGNGREGTRVKRPAISGPDGLDRAGQGHERRAVRPTAPPSGRRTAAAGDGDVLTGDTRDSAGIRNATVSAISRGEPSRPHGSARFAGASIAAAWSPDAPQALRIGVSMATGAPRASAGRAGATARS